MKPIRPGILVFALVKLGAVSGAMIQGDLLPALALWLFADAWLLWQMLWVPATGLGPVATHFTPAAREVWLTIDDGPDPHQTPAILQLLAQHHARATFFVIGQKAAAHPALIRAILAHGHEVALHTHTHPAKSFWFAGPRRIAAELDANLAAVRAAGAEPTRFRPPVGLKSPFLHPQLATRGLAYIAWSARGRERAGPDAPAVAARLWPRVRPGAILLLHEGEAVPPPIRIEAVRLTLARLAAAGYAAVVPRADQLA
jgi:peptidoglycan/xylan/chitin deacetylase (PgdA/CDA1 family)